MVIKIRPREDADGKPGDRIAPVPGATLPYWRTQLHRLDEHRSTESIPSECDVAIIGCGMSGVSTAYHLIRQYGDKAKPSIVLLDARQVCSGATGRNGGHIKAKATTLLGYRRNLGFEIAEEMAAFLATVRHDVKAVVEKENLDCEFELRRSFDVFLNEKEGRDIEEAFRSSVERGEHWTRDVAPIPKEFVEQITSISGAKAAFSVPACSLWPYKFVTQLLDRIIEHVNLQTNTPVTEIVSDDDSRTQLIRTTRGELRAKKVVFASNAYTGGISSTYFNKIVPYRGTASHLVPDKPVSPHLTQTYNIDYSSHVDYLNPRPDGSIVVGGASSRFREQRELWFNNWDDSQLIPNVHEYFDTLMEQNFKGWGHAMVDRVWTGIMGLTADRLPHIGEIPGQEGKQYVIAGFNGGGMSLIFSCARGLAEMIKDGVQFDDTGMPQLFRTSLERLNKPVEGIETKKG